MSGHRLNYDIPVYLEAGVQDEINQLFESVAFRSGDPPEQYQVVLWDDPGVPDPLPYPESSNAGATLTSLVKILPDGDMTDIRSMSLDPQGANPGGVTTVWINDADGHLYRDAVDLEAVGSGDVAGPASSTDNAVVRFDGITGKLLQDTSGFTCDDSFNVVIGNVGAADRLVNLRSGQNITLFLEADATGGPTEQENPTIVMTQDTNLNYAGIAMRDDEVGDTVTNYLLFQVSSSVLNNMEGIYFRTGGIHTGTPVGTPVTTFTTQPVDAMRIRNDNQKVMTYAGLMTNLIEERTAANGVLIDGVRLKDGSVNCTTAAANPGGANTLWQRTSDGVLFRGAVNLEQQGDLVGPASSVDNAIPRFDGVTGKLLQNTASFTCDDNFNVKIGDITTDADRLLHIQGKQKSTLFIEADTNCTPDTDTSTIVMSQDTGGQYVTMGFVQNGAGNYNDFGFSRANKIGASDDDDFVFLLKGKYANIPYVGNPYLVYTTPPTEVLRLNAGTLTVDVTTSLKANTIDELTAANGVLIDGVRLKDSSVELPTTTSTAGLIKVNGITQFQNRNGSNLFLGNSGNFTTTGVYNYGIGDLAMRDITTGSYNIAFGRDSGIFLTTGGDNILMGRSSGGNLTGTNGRRNIGIGTSALESAGTDAQSNIAIGYFGGASLTNNDSNNILIGNSGSPGLNANIRVGTVGTHTSCYVAGIHNQMQANNTTSMLAAIDSDGKLTHGFMGMAELSFENYAPVYTLATPVAGTFYEVAPIMTLLTNFSAKFIQSANGRIQYLGVHTMLFHCAISLSSKPTTNNDTCAFELRKNGVKVDRSTVRQKYGTTTDFQNSAQHVVVSLATNDYISIFAANLVSTTGIDFGNINLVAVMS